MHNSSSPSRSKRTRGDNSSKIKFLQLKIFAKAQPVVTLVPPSLFLSTKMPLDYTLEHIRDLPFHTEDSPRRFKQINL